MDANKVTNEWYFSFVELLYYVFVAASISVFVKYLVNFIGDFTLTVLRLIICLFCGDLDRVTLLIVFLGVVTKSNISILTKPNNTHFELCKLNILGIGSSFLIYFYEPV